MAGKFKSGDLVSIKSGGPVMTVKNTTTDGKIVYCQWFTGGKLNDGGFSSESLEPATKKASKDEDE